MESDEPLENKPEVKIRKVPVDTVLRILSNLFNNGVDYVDFHGKIGDMEDVLGISFSKDYVDPEYMQQFEDMEEDELSEELSDLNIDLEFLDKKEEIKVKLSDDDINKLL